MSMSNSYYSWALSKGITRRDFLKFCTAAAAMMGLESALVPKIVHAMENKPRVPVIYLNLQECTCCSESFIRSGHPLASDLILNMLSIDYMEVLQAAAGEQAEAARLKTMADYHGQYLLVVEGSPSLGDGGIYCTIGGKTSESVLKETAEGAMAVIAFGSCAVNGCIQGSHPNPTGAVPVHEVIKNKPIVKVPGCPPIAEVITGTIVHYLTFGTLPELTNQGRPKAFYQHRIHDNCNRRAFFDAGQFVEAFNDEGARQGWCLYKMGCKGPSTYNACAITQWNEGLSYPIKSGHPCLGCSEDHYWDNGPIYTHLAHIPNMAHGYNPDQIGLAAVGAAAAGVAVHSVATALVNKNKQQNKTTATTDSNQPLDV